MGLPQFLFGRWVHHRRTVGYGCRVLTSSSNLLLKEFIPDFLQFSVQFSCPFCRPLFLGHEYQIGIWLVVWGLVDLLDSFSIFLAALPHALWSQIHTTTHANSIPKLIILIIFRQRFRVWTGCTNHNLQTSQLASYTNAMGRSTATPQLQSDLPHPPRSSTRQFAESPRTYPHSWISVTSSGGDLLQGQLVFPPLLQGGVTSLSPRSWVLLAKMYALGSSWSPTVCGCSQIPTSMVWALHGSSQPSPLVRLWHPRTEHTHTMILSTPLRWTPPDPFFVSLTYPAPPFEAWTLPGLLPSGPWAYPPGYQTKWPLNLRTNLNPLN